MAKLTLSDLSNLQNESSAVTTINNNNTAIETAIENTLSRDGSTPNMMAADLDMNSNSILNLPDALTAQEPVTLGQFEEAIEALDAGAVVNATYVTVDANAGLANERVLTAGDYVSVTDGGANSTITVDVSDPQLVALAEVVAAADTVPYFTAEDTADVTSLTSFARTLLDDTDATTARTTLGLEIGADVQAWDADLDAFALKTAPSGDVVGTTDSQALTNKTISGSSNTITNIGGTSIRMGSDAQGDILYFNGTDYTRLGPGTNGHFLQTQGAAANPQWVAVPGGGDLLSTNNLSDVADADTSADNINAVRFTSQTLSSGEQLQARANIAAKRWTYVTPSSLNTQSVINWTSLPAGTDQIEIYFIGASTSGTTDIQVGLGDSGGFETSGYISSSATHSNGVSPVVASQTTFFGLGSKTAAAVWGGVVRLTLLDPATFTWGIDGSLAFSGSTSQVTLAGYKPLSAELDRVRIQIDAGATTWDAGTAAIRYRHP